MAQLYLVAFKEENYGREPEENYALRELLKQHCSYCIPAGKTEVWGPDTHEQKLVQVYKRTVCRRGTFLGSSNCHNQYGAIPNTFDKEFIVTYMSTDGEKSRGMITFLHQRTSDDFQIELEEWSGSLLRVIGPNITID